MDLNYVISPNRPICTTPPLRSVPRPIGEAFAFTCWASGLTKQPISGKLTLSQLQDEEKTTGISPKFRETEPSGSDSAVWQTGTKSGICNLGCVCGVGRPSVPSQPFNFAEDPCFAAWDFFLGILSDILVILEKETLFFLLPCSPRSGNASSIFSMASRRYPASRGAL